MSARRPLLHAFPVQLRAATVSNAPKAALATLAATLATEIAMSHACAIEAQIVTTVATPLRRRRQRNVSRVPRATHAGSRATKHVSITTIIANDRRYR